MRILSRYFFREFCKFFFICLFGMMAILVVAEFFDKADEFYEKKAPVYVVVQYLLLQAPQSLLFASPIASLLAVLFIIGIASKWKETVAIRSSGGSIKRLFSSFLGFGIVISILALVFGETIIPMAASKASTLRYTKILKRPSRVTYREGVLWVKGMDGSLIRIRDFVENEDKILKVSIFKFRPFFRLFERIEAVEAEWTDNRWEMKNVTTFNFERDDIRRTAHSVLDSLEAPEIFVEELKKPAEMNFFELYRYYKRLERAGFKNNSYVMELQGKLALPLFNFIMMLFGTALALNSRLGGGVRAAGMGLAVIIVTWMIFWVSLSLGRTGALPPGIAPWVSPLVCTVAGSLLYARVRE